VNEPAAVVEGGPAFAGALQFLTRIPLRLSGPASRRAMAPWFPVVGALIGAGIGGIAAALQYWLTPLAAAAVAVAVGMLVTGAFHEDGLADLADAIAGGSSRERRFAILRDSRLGTFGTAALAGSILLRTAGLAALAAIGPAVVLAAGVAAHAVARGAAIAVIGFAPAASPDGLGASFASDVSRARAASTVAIATSIALVTTGWWGGPILAIASGGAAIVAVVSVRALGGVTGDVAGAAEQIAEIAALLTASALAAHHGLWWR
jgi:adenosylcobinamide-GDP ribazoletransferase